MRTAGLALPAALLVAALGCTGDAGPRVIQPGAPGEPNRVLSAEEASELEIPPPAHTDADVDFMRGMIHHHAQALDMTALVPDRAAREDLPLFAERIDITQREEIGLMRGWLEARGLEAPAAHDEGHAGHDAGALMPGMATPEEMAELEAARGTEFDRLFLVLMTRHHRGALEMVADLFAAGGGEEPEIFRFANHVDADQRIEIERMATMLAEIAAQS